MHEPQPGLLAEPVTHMVRQALGSGLWPVMVLLSEVVQTFILADFW